MVKALVMIWERRKKTKTTRIYMIKITMITVYNKIKSSTMSLVSKHKILRQDKEFVPIVA
jgi:hypothetical protein